MTSPRRTAFRLRTVFAAILLVILLLPLTGVHFFRIYENELVRQTESELIAQAVFIASYVKDALGRETKGAKDYGAPATVVAPPLDEKYRPYPPQLDLRTARILPPRPDARRPQRKPDPAALKIGRALTPILLDARLSLLSSVRLLDFRGTIVGGTGEPGLSLAHTEEVAEALKGVYVSRLRHRISDEPRPALASLSRGTDTRIFIALPVIVHDRVAGIVYISRSPRNVLKSLYDERGSVFIAGILMLLITAGIASLLGYTIAKPLAALTRHAQQLTLGARPKERLSAPPIAELISLMQSFEQMSSTIEARSEYIRSFAMHVAHEFKTPLTSIQGAIELLHDHTGDMKPEQRRRFMENIMEDTDRLKTLVSRLLDLARADVMQPGGESASLAQIADSLKRRYAGRIAVSAPEKDWRAGMGPDILETVLVNLIENGLQHGAKNIGIGVTDEDDMLGIDVTDDGEGVSAGNAARLFTPFFTTRRDAGGTGLGLAITRSLLKAHGGDIRYVAGGKGAHFRLSVCKRREAA